MSIEPPSHFSKKSAIEFKSSSFTVPALLLHSNDMSEVLAKLQQKLQQAPEFFKNSPILLDIQAINSQGSNVNIADLIKLIRSVALIPVGLRGGSFEQNQIALKMGVPIQSIHTAAHDHEKLTLPEPSTEPQAITVTPPETSLPVEAENSAESILITTPIRSGQRVYASGDLVILAQVSAGAEIMAEGNIHVYGSLRGRALAGVQGNPEARIFCFDLQAELISIAGNYKVSDDLDKSMQHKPVQIYLQDHALIIKEL